MGAMLAWLIICMTALLGPSGGPDRAAPRSRAFALAPAEFRVQLDTTKGPIVIEVRRDWAPLGADRFHELVTSGYFNDTRFFRVVAGPLGAVRDQRRSQGGDGVAEPDVPRRSAKQSERPRDSGVCVCAAQRADDADLHRARRICRCRTTRRGSRRSAV